MLNTLLLNTAPLNTGTPVPFAGTVDDYSAIEFNGYSLQGLNTISSAVEAFSAPSRDVLRFKKPRTDGGGWNGDYFREREIRVSGIIKADTAEELNDEIDTFKQTMTKSRGLFTMKINDEVRQIEATLINPQEMFSRREGYHVTFTPFDLTFVAVEPMWHALDYNSLTFEDINLLSYPSEVEVFGTYKAQPVIVILLQQAVGITTVSFENTTNTDALSITAAFAAGDVILIDSEVKSVTLNGVEVEYDGVFPELETGTNEFVLTATGTSIEYTGTVKYRPTYL